MTSGPGCQGWQGQGESASHTLTLSTSPSLAARINGWRCAQIFSLFFSDCSDTHKSRRVHDVFLKGDHVDTLHGNMPGESQVCGAARCRTSDQGRRLSSCGWFHRTLVSRTNVFLWRVPPSPISGPERAKGCGRPSMLKECCSGPVLRLHDAAAGVRRPAQSTIPGQLCGKQRSQPRICVRSRSSSSARAPHAAE